MTLFATDSATTLRPSTATSVAETAATNILLGAVGFTTGTVAARWLGPEGRGELAAIQMWPSLIATLAMIGLPEALSYHAARHPAEGRRYLLTASLTVLALMPFFVAAGYVLMPFLLSTQSDRAVLGARRYLLLAPIFLLLGVPQYALRGIQHYRLWNVLRSVAPLLWLLVVLGGVWLGVTDPTAMTTTYLVLGAAVGPVVAWTAWRRVTGPASPTVPALSSLLKFGLPSALSTLPQLVNVRLDQMMVAALLSPRQLGLYASAVAWGGCIPLLSNAVAVIASTRMATDTSKSGRSRVFTRGIQGAVWLIAVPVILLGAATPLGVTVVFGHAFEQAVLPAMVLVVASGVNAFNVLLEELLRGSGKPSATLWAETVAVSVSLSLLTILLPRLGLMGASLASLGGYAAATTMLIAYSRHCDLHVLAALDPRDIAWTEAPVRAYRAVQRHLG